MTAAASTGVIRRSLPKADASAVIAAFDDGMIRADRYFESVDFFTAVCQRQKGRGVGCSGSAPAGAEVVRRFSRRRKFSWQMSLRIPAALGAKVSAFGAVPTIHAGDVRKTIAVRFVPIRHAESFVAVWRVAVEVQVDRDHIRQRKPM